MAATALRSLKTVLCFVTTQVVFHWVTPCDATRESQDATDVAALLQRHRSGPAGLLPRDWRSARDLANVTRMEPIRIGQHGQDIDLNFFSAVPTFGPDGNYIALLHKIHKDNAAALSNLTLFCSDVNGEHRSRVRIFGHEKRSGYQRTLAFQCDWPESEAHLKRFEVLLQDQAGQRLGVVVAEHNPGLLQQYRTVVCVRDTYPHPKTGLKLLPQWLEFNLAHGVDHFIIYTVNIEQHDLVKIYDPYVQSGKATRVHFDYDFDPGDYKDRFLHDLTTADCLYRSKNHAQWVLPTLDIDEFFVAKDGSLFPGGTVPEDYVGSTWDAVVHKHGYQSHQVHSVLFQLFRFQPQEVPGEVELLSTVRDSRKQRSCPKYAFNPKVVNTIFIHWVTSWKDGTKSLKMDINQGWANHYRFTDEHNRLLNLKYGVSDVTDDALAHFAPQLEQDLTKRFGRDPKELLIELEQVPLVQSRGSLLQDTVEEASVDSEIADMEDICSCYTD